MGHESSAFVISFITQLPILEKDPLSEGDKSGGAKQMGERGSGYRFTDTAPFTRAIIITSQSPWFNVAALATVFTLLLCHAMTYSSFFES